MGMQACAEYLQSDECANVLQNADNILDYYCAGDKPSTGLVFHIIKPCGEWQKSYYPDAWSAGAIARIHPDLHQQIKDMKANVDTKDEIVKRFEQAYSKQQDEKKMVEEAKGTLVDEELKMLMEQSQNTYV